ncbi:MAG: PAS domain S-box protein, partial [candidate division Zixibacteria bacterium]|nr:PAS domain S-box protein [candidate division Zixibacteria bacterium]
IGFIHPEDKQLAEKAFRKAMDEGKSYKIEYRIIRPDGDIRFVQVIGHVERDERGRILSVYGTGQDITEIKKVELALKRSEATLQGILQAAPVGIGLLYNRTFDWVNEGFTELTGYTAEELKGKNARILYQNDAEYERVGSVKYGQISDQGTGALETQFVRKDGNIVDVFISTAAIDSDDPSAGYVSTAFDITEQKRARERTDYHAKLVENISDAVISTDLDFRIKSWNRAAEIIYGWREDKVFDKKVGEVLSTEFTGTTPEEAVEALKKEGVWRGDVVQICEDGSRLNIMASVVLVKDSQGNPSGVVAVNRDITELKAVERQLRESEHKYRQLYERSLAGIVSTDLEGNFIGCNVSYEKMLGYSLEELKNLTYHELTPEKWHASEEKIVRENIIKKGYSGLYEKEYIRKDGTIIQVELSSYLIRDESGEPTAMWGIARDITAKKQAEQALLAEKERLNVTLRSIGDAVITTDTLGNVILINSIAEKLTGWNEEEAKGQHITSIFEIVNEHTREAAENPADRVLKEGVTVGLANHTVIISRDGQERLIDDSGAPIRDEKGEIIGVVLVFRDVTDQRRMQEYFSRAQRLETAGKVAGQIAHDFNNLLGPLIAYPDFIRMQIPKDHEVLNYVNDMEKAAEQIAEINQQLLTLSRRGYYKQEALDLNEIISDAINQMKPHADTLVINPELEEELYRVKGGRSQIYRVIVNLLHNAREAMTDIGTLTVKTENFYVDEISGKFGRVPKGEYVKLSVIDTGNGIPDDLLSKIFDPFFTTKEADKRRGSGLGLSVVHAVVQDHEAFIDLETTLGKGSAFYVYFPLTREESGKSEPESIIRGNNESVLVVDDDVIQREVSLRLLGELGYRAEAARSGEEAIELLKEGPRDLLLLDMVMPPGMDGTETYQKALKINPEQKAIIISGFAESERVKMLQELGAGEYIRKPLNMKSLSAAVRRELERRGDRKEEPRD